MIHAFHLLLLLASRLLLLLLAPQATTAWSLPVTRREAFGILATTTASTSTIMGVWSLPALAEDDESKSNTTTTTIAMTTTEEQEQARRQALVVRMKERRQLMEASRSSDNRQSYLDLSRQRAALYNTTSKAVSCPPNIPCF